MAYQVDTSAEAALGLMVSYLCALGLQIPDANVTILGDTCKILSVFRQSDCPYIKFVQIRCKFLFSA